MKAGNQERRQGGSGRAIVALVLWGLAVAGPSQAADTTNYMWTKTGTSTSLWSLASNWTNNIAPLNGGGQGTILTFGGNTGNMRSTNDFSTTPFVLNSLVFTNAGMTLTLLGGDLQFAGTAGGVPPILVQLVS